MKKRSGFEVTNVAGQGFKRVGNETTIIYVNDNGFIPGELQRIAQATDVMQFNKAYHYAKMRADNFYFDFREITVEVKRFEGVREFFCNLLKINHG